jgi:hypothetical protein
MEEVGFNPIRMAWNGGSRFCPDWNGLEWREPLLALLEWFRIEEVGFGFTEIAWKLEEVGFGLPIKAGNVGRRFWSWIGKTHFCTAWHGLDWPTLILYCRSLD